MEHVTRLTESLQALKNHAVLICLIGKPGCGKNLKGEVMRKALGDKAVHIISSKLIQSHIDRNTEIGSVFKKEQRGVDGGKLNSDAAVLMAHVEEIMERARHGAKYFILNGGVRTIPQAKAFIVSGVPISTFMLDVGEETSIARVIDRTEREGGRSDDGAIYDRLQVFVDETEPAGVLLRNHNPNRFTRVDTEASTVQRQVVQMFRALKNQGFISADVLNNLFKKLSNPNSNISLYIKDKLGKAKKEEVPEPTTA
jgi:adenylate kinase family enzyme